MHIFKDYLNGLYVIKIQIKYSTLHNNHHDKTIPKEIVTMFQQSTHPTSLHKVCAYAKIESNEQIDKLAKEERDKEQEDAFHLHEFAHSMPYYYQKDLWHSMDETLEKRPIRLLEKHFIKYDRFF